jgi:hypothetical protein
MNSFKSFRKLILILVLAFGFVFCSFPVCAEGEVASASSRRIEQSVENVEPLPKKENPVQLHFVMIACLFLVGGALGMVLLNPASNNSEKVEDELK